jgi:hypothetical protein
VFLISNQRWFFYLFIYLFIFFWGGGALEIPLIQNKF